MKQPRRNSKWPWLAALATVGTHCSVLAQFNGKPPPEDPEWLKFRFTEISTGIFAEGDYEKSKMVNSGASSQYSRMFVGPTLGVNFAGSVWHPNLFQYQVNSQNAFGWGNETTSSTSQTTAKEMEYLGFFQGNANLFAGAEPKPFASTLFANYDHTYHTYDFFNQVQEDVWRYGLTTGYSDGPVPVQAGYWHRDQLSYGSTGMHSIEDVVNFNLRNTRNRGASGLDYGYNRYNRIQDNQVGYGTDQILSINDAENFGSRQQYHLNSNASYSKRDDSVSPSDEWIAAANLTADHSDTLTSLCNLNYDNYSSGGFGSQNYSGDGALRHKLYDSLTSTLLSQGSYYEYTDGPSSSRIGRYGGGFSEGYKKSLSESHSLSLDNSLLVEHSDVDNTGTFTIVMDERHTFDGTGGAPPGSFFLNQPRILESTIVITDLAHTQPPYLQSVDYQVLRTGFLTMIQRIPGGRIGPTEVVLASYRALASPSGSYGTLTEAFRFRVSLWNDKVGLYTRVSLSLNNAPAELLVQNLRDYAFGVDFKWHNFRTGVEYEIYDSNLSSYTALRLFQSYAWQLDEASNLSVNFNESWTTFQQADRQEQWYMFITRYHRALTWRLGFDLEGGVSLRRGPGVDQTLATCRPGIEYTAGKTSIKAGYDYEYNLFLDSQEQRRNMFFIRAKRVF
jgi:hypothetical protein